MDSILKNIYMSKIKRAFPNKSLKQLRKMKPITLLKCKHIGPKVLDYILSEKIVDRVNCLNPKCNKKVDEDVAYCSERCLVKTEGR